MSRTYRRKNAPHLEKWELTDFARSLEFGYWVRIPLQGAARTRKCARFHSDAYKSHDQPPMWFGRLLDEAKKTAARKRLQRALRAQDWRDWDVVDDRWPRDAGQRW